MSWRAQLSGQWLHRAAIACGSASCAVGRECEVESTLCVSGVASEWVGRSEGPTGLSRSESGRSVGRFDPQEAKGHRIDQKKASDRLGRGPRGSVGRVFRPKICFAALRAAGRSVGRAESETRDFKKMGRSGDTQSVLSTSHSPHMLRSLHAPYMSCLSATRAITQTRTRRQRSVRETWWALV